MLGATLLHGALFVGAIVLYGRWLDDEAVGDVCLYGLACELILAMMALSYFGVTDSLLFMDMGVIQSGVAAVTLQLLLCFDALSGFFLGILTVALLVCFYFLLEYFEYDAGSSWIITLSALFSQAALLFFCAYDLILIVFLWETISIISFLLVQHWSHRLPTYKAGLKVFTISQIGDLPLFGFLFLTLSRFETSSLVEVLGLLPLAVYEYVMLAGMLVSLLTCLALLLSQAVFLKAAQFFFYPWLLDAMEAPVPISAQLHSSTLVVIGFYLFYRFQLLFTLVPSMASLFVVYGVTTVVGASVLGFFQIDGKRLLACSTASQLGYVVVSLGLGLYEEALLLLAFCCCNKAFTFVWFGVLMHKHAGLSDFRFVGGASRLAWLEHGGLVVALANFTVLPGAFSWHAKGLFVLGQTPFMPSGAAVGLEVLQLTWFFSSLYLVSLYLTLFLRPTQGQLQRQDSLSQGLTLRLSRVRLSLIRALRLESWASLLQTSRGGLSLSFFMMSVLIFSCLLAPTVFGFLWLFDVSWATYETVGLLAYY